MVDKDSQAERAAPALDAEGLPPLPAQHDELRARWECEDCNGRGHDGEAHWQGHFQPPEPFPCSTCGGNGSVRADAYTAEQVRQAQRDAVEAYARRLDPAIDKLREQVLETRAAASQLARQDQQPTRVTESSSTVTEASTVPPARASVDTDDFRHVLWEWMARLDYFQSDEHREVEEAWRALIAHINAWGGVTEDHTKPEK